MGWNVDFEDATVSVKIRAIRVIRVLLELDANNIKKELTL
jgi:hypothetical protein